MLPIFYLVRSNSLKLKCGKKTRVLQTLLLPDPDILKVFFISTNEAGFWFGLTFISRDVKTARRLGLAGVNYVVFRLVLVFNKETEYWQQFKNSFGS